jgi:hypothetical protein
MTEILLKVALNTITLTFTIMSNKCLNYFEQFFKREDKNMNLQGLRLQTGSATTESENAGLLHTYLATSPEPSSVSTSTEKLAYIRKYYSIIVCEMHQYIKRHLNRHHDASLGHSPNNFCNLRYITINFWCLFLLHTYLATSPEPSSVSTSTVRDRKDK